MNDKIEITEKAQKHIAKVISQDKADYFRITVQGGGCAGFQYKFNFDNNKHADDIVFEKNNITVIIDSTSLNFCAA